ncbi:hypothetical protein HanRHA438_Chr06g0247961 [Helianthus annuus]|uniref:Uncharacterized protein n=1 Tax=Helianthus annuus TaxID=4232 RepID=A0A9K3I4P0_HELAN|nr:hypothetical protein HanXRQr2_Chr09g0382161 [Helianthus annuus]KAJ0910034.1 hypothetical protein HanRHA438_Chr06g0247961 [Helianthus annuus]
MINSIKTTYLRTSAIYQTKLRYQDHISERCATRVTQFIMFIYQRQVLIYA